MRVARDGDVLARREHLRRPTRAAQHRRGAHLAAHLRDLAVLARRIEVEVRVRVDEVDAGDGALEHDHFRPVESAEAVVRPQRSGDRDERAERDDLRRLGHELPPGFLRR